MVSSFVEKILTNEATKGEQLSEELEQIWLTIADNGGKTKGGGGYKLTSLVCLLLANSDDKRGHTTDFRVSCHKN